MRKSLYSYLVARARRKSDINEHLLLLYKLATVSNSRKIVELGTRDGNSTLALVLAAAETNGKVISVDYGRGAKYSGEESTWNALSQTSELITDKLRLGNYWTLVMKDDLPFGMEYKDEIDLLFMDTVHSYEQTKKELEIWGEKVVNGGYIIIHDTVSFPEQNKAIWEFLDKHPGSDYVEHKYCNGLGIMVKGALHRRKETHDKIVSVKTWMDRADRMQEALLDLRLRLREAKRVIERRSERETRRLRQAILIQERQMKRVEQKIHRLRSELPRLNDPMGRLLLIYRARPDLQVRMPEVERGDYSRLLDWAKEQIFLREDIAYDLLADNAGWYDKSPWHELLKDKFALQSKLDAAMSNVSTSEKEISQLRKTLAEVKDRLSEREVALNVSEAQIASIKQALEQLKSQTLERKIDLLAHTSDAKTGLKIEGQKSVPRRPPKFSIAGFALLWIDRLFPYGTWRGGFRKTIATSIRTAREQGFRAFARQAIEKIRLREFHILEPRDELNDEVLRRNLKRFLAESPGLEFPIPEKPIVSVIIVTYNNSHYTYESLRRLQAFQLPEFEIIIVDNGSQDETRRLLHRTRSVVVMENSKNEFFVAACNQGASAARGTYLLFLNNDAFVQPDCVSSLVRTIESSADIGAVGAKLVHRDGRLQEAGSVIWQDGSALGYGRDDDPSKPEYCYTRDVDYCSAACLLVRRDIFESLGGFDEDFSPAYYEDSDLCVRVWRLGYRVVYEPYAVATHVEYASSSPEAAVGLIGRHRVLFVEKNKEDLAKRLPYSPSHVICARDRRTSPSVLVVDDCTPKPDEGSGYPRLFLTLKFLATLGYKVTLVPMTAQTPKQPETRLLNQMGVEICWDSRLGDLLKNRPDYYDIAIISRPHNALFALNPVKENNPHARIIYDAEALWYRREQMKQQLGLPPMDPRFVSEDAELSFMKSADYVMAVSQNERRLIEEKLPGKEVFLWGHPHPLNPTSTPFEQRSNFLFLAGFKSSPAHNDDAAIYLAQTLFPRIRARIPDSKLIIAGSHPPEWVKRLASDSILVIGYLNDVKEAYGKCRVFVAPFRFAGGAMWKVTEAMSFGLPTVLSRVAADGLGIQDGREALIAQDDEDFIDKCIRLYQDSLLWAQIRNHGLDHVKNNCDPAIMIKQLKAFMEKVVQDDRSERNRERAMLRA